MTVWLLVGRLTETESDFFRHTFPAIAFFKRLNGVETVPIASTKVVHLHGISMGSPDLSAHSWAVGYRYPLWRMHSGWLIRCLFNSACSCWPYIHERELLLRADVINMLEKTEMQCGVVTLSDCSLRHCGRNGLWVSWGIRLFVGMYRARFASRWGCQCGCGIWGYWHVVRKLTIPFSPYVQLLESHDIWAGLFNGQYIAVKVHSWYSPIPHCYSSLELLDYSLN